MKQLIIATLIGIAMPLAAEAASQTEPNLAMGDSLTSSYWRNDRTGDWEIAFFDDCAIYRSKYWTYKQRDVNPKTGEATLLLSNGTDDLPVSVGRYRKGTRTMRIGRQKVTCSRLTDRYLPDYPTKDTRTDFVNNGYRRDTITVTGWIKDIPENYSLNKTVEFICMDIFSGMGKSIVVKLDEHGRFTAELPVVNSTDVICHWADEELLTILEPGRDYLMLYAPQEKRFYFMGEDVRLQNELLRHAPHVSGRRIKEGEDFDHFLAASDSIIQTNTAKVDHLCDEHPMLSTRFMLYCQGDALWDQASNIGQSRFRDKHYRFTDTIRDYARENLWTKIPEPLTLHRDASQFIRDYISEAEADRPRAHIKFEYLEHYEECASNEEELAVLRRWAAFINETISLQRIDPEEAKRIAPERIARNREMLDSAQKIFNSAHVMNVYFNYEFRADLPIYAHFLDSIGASPLLKDIYLCRMAYNNIENNCRPLPEATMDTLRALVTTPLALDRVEQKNNDTKDILNNRVVKASVQETPKPIETGEGIRGIDSTDGKALLQSILAPLRGKFVLLDIWGTWCGPCRMALQNSTEEYERLKAFDIVCLYLANSSPKEEWENVIKMYNVNGDNVVHYNLPREQQQAIEQHLNVHSYPNYKLFDRNGNLLDMKVDARNLFQLENVLRQLSGQ